MVLVDCDLGQVGAVVVGLYPTGGEAVNGILAAGAGVVDRVVGVDAVVVVGVVVVAEGKEDPRASRKAPPVCRR